MLFMNFFMLSTASSIYQANAVDFDGSNDYLSRASLTGAVNGKKGTFCCFFRLDGGDGSTLSITEDSSNLCFVQRTAGNKIRIKLTDATDGVTANLDMATSNSYTSSSTWHSLLASWDLSAGTNYLYIDGVSDLVTTANINANVDYSALGRGIGGTNGGANKFNGCLAEIYLNMSDAVDFSSSVNRAKFITDLNKPVSLGPTGSIPTGSAPILYLRSSAGIFGTNSGTGGDYSITGTLDVASTSPSD